MSKELNASLISAMETYLNAGLAMDLEKMDAIYAPDFENIRMDRDGRTFTITKDQFMQRFHAMRSQGKKLDTTDDVEFLATTLYDGHGSVIMRRVKNGKPVLYNFVWRMEAGHPSTLIREFTYEEDISYLTNLLK
ncbi:nuclear transport factor 2 family protein [Paenibacillus andongensis]|uniref:nuclear transport factor 2 family protein n=1 Tax=Paenibacillus andongensis TaxID=2975482 RepID=UPI0021BB165D|nr:nuclear transport factor 2 family protein [Paenibacillus andongensis]